MGHTCAGKKVVNKVHVFMYAYKNEQTLQHK